MRPPIRRLTKTNLEWLSSHHCKAHRTAFLDGHYNCFLKEAPADSPFKERLGFFDIESTGLKGNWDFVLSYCIKELDGPILGRHLTQREITTYRFDKNLILELIRDLNSFDRVATFYGMKFDIPFVRTRAEHWELDFPAYRDLWQTDIYYIAKQSLLLHSTRLEQVCKLLKIPAKEHKLEPDIWQKAQAGHQESLDWIHTHCCEDVTSLEAVYKRLNKYTIPAKRSI